MNLTRCQHFLFIKHIAFLLLFFSSYTYSAQPPFILAINGGATNVKYNGQTELGEYWSVNANFALSNTLSLSTGYAQTSAEIPDSLGVKQDFTSHMVPLNLTLSYYNPLGTAYLKGGANFFRIEYEEKPDDGLSYVGLAGFRFNPVYGVSVATEMTYFGQFNLIVFSEIIPAISVKYIHQEYGDAKTANLAVGGTFMF